MSSLLTEIFLEAEGTSVKPAPTTAGVSATAIRSGMVAIAVREWNRWNKGAIKESELSMRSILMDYWNNTPGGSNITSKTNWWNIYAWSAAFICYVVRNAGAGNAFHYNSYHTTYTYYAKQNRIKGTPNTFKAFRTTERKPQPGDIIVQNYDSSGRNYDNVKPNEGGAHGDIVVEVSSSHAKVIGGNVGNSVSQRQYPLNSSGFLSSGKHWAIVAIDDTQSSPQVARSVLVTSTPAAINWTTVSTDQRILYVMKLLVNNYRFPINGASGLVGNLLEESQLLPNRIEGSSSSTPMRANDFQGQIRNFSALEIMNRNFKTKTGPRFPGVGLAQWTSGPRRSRLFQHQFQGRQLGAAILFDMKAQVDYLVKELQTNFRNVYKIIITPFVSVNDASDEVVYNFEIPGSVLDASRRKLPRSNPSVQAVFIRRRKSALRAFNVYKNAHP